MIDRYSPKDPSAIEVMSMDFTNLTAGDTISSCVVDVLRLDMQPEVTAAMVVGLIDITAKPIVKQKIGGGNHGTDYIVRFTATMASGQVVVASAALLVKNGG